MHDLMSHLRFHISTFQRSNTSSIRERANIDLGVVQPLFVRQVSIV